MENFTDFLMEKIVMPGFALLLALFVLALPVAIYALYKADQSPTFSLRKDRWTCTAAHNETSTTYIIVGKVAVPSTSTHSVCDQWSAHPV